MVFWLAALVVIGLDRLTKNLVIGAMAPGESIPVIEGIFHITYVRNPGGAFGLLPQGQALFLLAALTVFFALIGYWVFRRPQGRLVALGLGLVLGGTAGNLIDRLFYGKVIDWLDFQIWPVFNVADSALVVGIAVLTLTMWRTEST